jgi:hypothetical protein
MERSKSELATGLQRARATLTKAKEETKQITRRGANVASTVGTGFAVGLARNKYGEGVAKELYIPGTEIEADLALGVVMAGMGVVGMGDEYSDILCSVGAGALAGNLAIRACLKGIG